MSELRDYQVDHLLLLVGSNPVPNAVAGKLLTKKESTITLIHSKDGLKLAQRLQSWFVRAGYSGNIGFKQVEESNAASVSTGVQQALNEYERKILAEDKSESGKKAHEVRVGLNYTGGTKVMSVHAYRTLEKWSNASNKVAIFSYLDARSLHMRLESVRSLPAISFYVGREVEISIEDLLELHDWELEKPLTKEPVLSESAKALLTIHSNIAQTRKWNEWRDNELLRKDRNPQEISWPNLPILAETLSKELGQYGAQYLNLTAANENEFRNWSSGTWLESAVLAALKDCPQELYLKECCMDIKPKVSGSSGGELFQFDVAAIRGYQLFAFSCTIADGNKRLLKQKLFEAYVRARQMGGDEACVALVCCAKQEMADELENEIRHVFNQEGRIRVFGREDLANLTKNIADWIRKQSKEG